MAEAAGLAFGALGAVNHAIQCFDLVRLARNFDQNFRVATLKLDIVKFRLSRWADSVGLTQAANGAQSPAMAPEDLQKAEELLKQIIDIFGDAEKKSTKSQSNNKNSEVYEDKDLDEATTSLHQKFRLLSLKRFKPTKALKATAWALYREKDFNRLIEDIKDLVESLVKLFPAAEPVRKKFCEEDGAELAAEKSAALAKPLIAELDPELDAAIVPLNADGGQTFHISFDNSTNHGLQQGHFSGHQINHFGTAAKS